MLRTRPLQLAGESEAHQAVHRRVGDLEPELAREPLSDLPVAVEAFACQALLKRVQRGRPQHLLSWLHSRLPDLQQPLQPARLVGREPVADAVSVQAEVLGRGFSAAHLAGGDQDQQVDAPLPLRISSPSAASSTPRAAREPPAAHGAWAPPVEVSPQWYKMHS